MANVFGQNLATPFSTLATVELLFVRQTWQVNTPYYSVDLSRLCLTKFVLRQLIAN